MPVRFEQVDPRSLPDWDERISALPGATFFHGATWAAILAGAYEFQPAYEAAFDDDRLAAVLPVVEADSWIAGRRGIGLPFTDHCAPVAADPRILHHLYARALERGRRRGWRTLELRGGAHALQRPVSISYVRHRLALPAGTPVGDDAMRRAARKAERNGVSVEFGSGLEAVREFYGLYCLTRRKHGVPPSPWRFFVQIHRHALGHAGCVALARHEGRAVAGALFLHFGRTAVFKFGASDPLALPLRANNLVLCRAITWHGDRGFTTLDLGRTSPDNSGLRAFKASLGAREEPLDYLRTDCRTGQSERTHDATQQWPTRVLRRLPPWTLQLIGRAAYRHFA